MGQVRLCINASRVPRDLVPGRCMHLLNHSCDPNCTVVSYAPDGWDNDLELLIFEAIQEIRQGQPVTFHYSLQRKYVDTTGAPSFHGTPWAETNCMWLQ